ncbi:MAG TPA: energy transducer TonB [Polyangiaceae bacterium]|nr:energy transducer TonB [Polyangiaceae bacterium]
MTHPEKKLFVGAMVLVGGLPACGGETANTPSPVSTTTTPAVSEQRPCVAPTLAAVRPRTESGEEISESEWPKGQWSKEATRPRLIAGSEVPELTGEQMMANRHRSVLLLARCKLHIDGTVSDCNMICPLSDPLFDATIIQNVEARRYTPVLFRGRPVEVPYTFTFRIMTE